MTIQEAINHAEDVVMEKSSEMAERIIGMLDTTDCKECMEQHKKLAEWLRELQQYRAIGTVEECRDARERQRAKKTKHQGCYDNNRVWHEWNGINGKPYELCPNCETNLCCEMPYDRKPKYCDNCGQKLDWSE